MTIIRYERIPITPSLALFAVTDETVSHVLEMVSLDATSWVGLYRILEAIESDLPKGGVLARFGPTINSDVRRFKHTANSPTAIGIQARHGKQTSLPPANPMQLEEAQRLIRAIAVRWLQSRYSQCA